MSAHRRRPTSATEPSVQLDLRPRVYYLLTDIRQQDLSYSRFRQSLKTFYFVSGPKRSVNHPFNCALEILFVYLLTDLPTYASASEMTYILSGGALNSTHSLTYVC